jgi:hypothetical protein
MPPESAHQQAQFVEVRVSTTSGFYPDLGQQPSRLPQNQKVEEELKRAARALNLTNTSAWIATVDQRQITVTESYQQNQLTGAFEVSWGPQHGGGG